MIVDLNVGGVLLTTTVSTLIRDKNSVLAQYFAAACDPENPAPPKPESTQLGDAIIQESPNRYFIDRDGQLFRYVLDYLRTGKVFLPDNFNEFKRLREEGRFYKLAEFLKQLKLLSPGEKKLSSAANGPEASLQESGYVSVGYRGTFAFGRDGQVRSHFLLLHMSQIGQRVV